MNVARGGLGVPERRDRDIRNRRGGLLGRGSRVGDASNGPRLTRHRRPVARVFKALVDRAALETWLPCAFLFGRVTRR